MIFQPNHIESIHKGIKTETRREWKRPMVKVGRLYPIMRDYRHKHNPKDGWIRVLEVYKQKLGDMTEAQAYAEGGYTRAQYYQVWIKINHQIDIDNEVWVVKFRFAPTQVVILDNNPLSIASYIEEHPDIQL